MELEVLLPHGVFLNERNVVRIVAESLEGSFGLLPHRLDCVAALVPGILGFETAEAGERFIAVDEGLLVKAGARVCVTVRRALAGQDLARLRDAVEREFRQLDEETRSQRAVLAKLETRLVSRLMGMRRG
jgi:F-type H+-transporting ATPase subunit epsilon